MKTAFFFGGSGYIGYHTISRFLELKRFDAYVIYDLQPPGYFEIIPENVSYIHCDVRKPIPVFDGILNASESWVFNFAAIHREPGHEAQEYFDTNINGAANINAFLEKLGILNLFFTSSIAPYGRSLDICSEDSPLYPESPYGISKTMAELIHQKWLAGNNSKRLVIVRPGVIYGPKDPGNIYRTIKALKKGIFVLPDGGNVVKAYGYVHGLVDSILFTMSKKEPLIVYNYAEHPLLNLSDMTQEIKKELGYKKPTLSLPTSILTVIAGGIQIVAKAVGKKSDIHPARVRKAGFPTNIKPQYLIDNHFEFKYGFGKSLQHWRSVEPKDFL